jgi:hypothetical protein
VAVKVNGADKCPKPRNEAEVERRRAEWLKNRPKRPEGKKEKGKKGVKKYKIQTSGIWVPPTPEEKNRRVIKGILYQWDKTRNFWDEVDKKKRAALAAATVPPVNAAPPIVPAVPPAALLAAPGGVPDARRAIRDAALSNASYAMQTALSKMAEAFQDI